MKIQSDMSSLILPLAIHPSLRLPELCNIANNSVREREGGGRERKGGRGRRREGGKK